MIASRSARAHLSETPEPGGNTAHYFIGNRAAENARITVVVA